MAEPALDLSEIIDMYKADARQSAARMEAAINRWDEIRSGGAARGDLRKLSHQLRGSGRTYGFRSVTCLCKAIENITQKLEKGRLPADDRVRASLARLIQRVNAVFAE